MTCWKRRWRRRGVRWNSLLSTDVESVHNKSFRINFLPIPRASLKRFQSFFQFLLYENVKMEKLHKSPITLSKHSSICHDQVSHFSINKSITFRYWKMISSSLKNISVRKFFVRILSSKQTKNFKYAECTCTWLLLVEFGVGEIAFAKILAKPSSLIAT